MKRTLILVLSSVLFLTIATGQEAREVHKTLPLAKGGLVSIDTYKGSITVSPWDRNEVDVSVKIEPDENWFDGSAEASEEDVRDTEIRIEGKSDEVRIKTDYAKLRHHRGGFWGMFDENSTNLPLVHYTVKVPRNANLKVKDYKSKTRISDLQSDVSFYTYKGDVNVAGLTGSINLETYKGEVRIDFAKLAGDSRIETYKGEIDLSLPKTAGFSLDSDLGSKADFDSDFGFVRETRGKRRQSYEFHGPVNGGGPTLHLKSTKGTYRLRGI